MSLSPGPAPDYPADGHVGCRIPTWSMPNPTPRHISQNRDQDPATVAATQKPGTLRLAPGMHSAKQGPVEVAFPHDAKCRPDAATTPDCTWTRPGLIDGKHVERRGQSFIGGNSRQTVPGSRQISISHRDDVPPIFGSRQFRSY